MTIKRNKPKFSQRIMMFFLLTAFISIGLLVFFWIQGEYSTFKTESESMRVSYLNAHKDLLKTEVNTALSYIEYQKARVEPRLKQSIQGRVNEAYAIASNIFNLYREKRTQAEMQEMVKDALRPIRFNEDRGYYFAFNLQGIETLFVDRPEMEGKDMLPVQGAQGEYVVRDMLDIVKSQKEGFYQYTWTKPNKEGHFSKIAFVKLFEPFGWVFGTGEYLDDVEGDIQEEVVEFIEKIRFGGDGYVFVGQWDGVSLTRPAKGMNMWDVTDTGNGMDTETLAHIFEPFFTTKGVGEGTGLGLATVYGAVKQNNGFINASSEPERGTTFTIYIPRFKDNVLPAARTVAGDNIPSGTETILLVEDEPMILKMTIQMLVGQGYHVLGASSPWEAIRLAKENFGSIDLLMTDVIMPEMNGRDLVKQLYTISPNIKCLFMSGYTANVIAHHGVLDEGVHFIQKPFSVKDLGRKLRDALEG